ncbi:MAG: efflux RND transporter permease subunit, partial [Proteobacteria bacterium]|nr:efflux RND transporter permease subunit [Pseudomonadota bacterium]
MPQSEERFNGLSRLVEFSLKRPVTVSMFFVTLVAIGLISSRLLPLENMPSINLPFFNINVPYVASTPEEVERTITRPLEEVLATIGEIENINSRSSTNGANVNLQFSSEADIDEKGMLIKEQIDLIRGELPADVRRIQINKARVGEDSIMKIRITGNRDLENSYDVLNQYLVNPLQRVAGVARVELQGIEPLEIKIMLDAERMKRYGIGINELSGKLDDANLVTKSGNFIATDQIIRIVPKTRASQVEDYTNLVLNENNIRLKDIATVEMINGERNYARHLNRKYSVGLEIYKESSANMVQVAEDVMKEIEQLSKSDKLDGFKLIFIDNQAQDVKESLQDVIQAGVVGSLLSLIVLFVFLRNIPMTIMIALSIPVSITITLGVMYFFGITLNILSLMGLMLAVGMLVDNSVVITESIFTQQTEHREPGNRSIIKGVKSVLTPVIAGTLTSICVFLPIIVRNEGLLSTFLTHVAVAII